MNGPGYLLSYDSPNEYGLFPSVASGRIGPRYRKGDMGGVNTLSFRRPRQSETGANTIILTHEQLDAFQSVDIRTVDKNTLTDMTDFVFDNTLPQAERVKRIFEKIKNPYLYRLGDMAVKLEFTEGGPSLQDLMASFLLRQKSGL